MSRASVRRATRASDLGKLMREAAGRRDLFDVFRDFIEMAACAISNTVDLHHRAEREERYLKTIGRYEKHEQALFPEMLAALVERMEQGPDDVLGRLFSELELYNADRGQFFTPYELCKTIAALQIGDPTHMAAAIEAQGFVTVSEPACGAGAMIIAFQDLMRQAGFNPQTQMHATCQDIDSRGVHMCYLHLSLLHIPAAVILGNTLAVECREVWYTPAHILGGWSRRLRLGRNPLVRAANDNEPQVQAASPEPEPEAAPVIVLPPAPIGEQIGLF
jgi:type I restriction-modification system DNA methylase subunit